MEYASPLHAAFGLLGLLAWCAFNVPAFKRAQVYMPLGERGPLVRPGRALVALCGVAAWALLSHALMRPRVQTGVVRDDREVNDVFFVVDVSRSMSAADFRPNRLEAAKREILAFVDLRPTDRIGIIMFADRVFTLLPLSTDLGLVSEAVGDVRMGFLGSGTNIGDALGLAVARGRQSLAKNKAVILLTDGVANVGSMTPLDAAARAREAGMRIYAIAMGRTDARMPTRNAFGVTGYQSIPGGSVDTETLKKVAETTGGRSFVAGSAESLKSVLAEIDRMERTSVEVAGRVVYEELHLPWLLAGAVLLVLSHLARGLVLREYA